MLLVAAADHVYPGRWVGLGTGMRSDHMVWRHTCSSIDFQVSKYWFKV